MSVVKSMSALLVAAGLAVGGASAATAADLPVKARPVATDFPLDVHGFFDFTVASTRVTGGGLLLYPSRGALTQTSVGLSLDIYKSPVGFINSFSVYGGLWNEFWSDPPVGGRGWQEMDWWAGFSVGFAKDWKFSAEILQFYFPSAIPTARNYVFTLAYNDASWGWPVALNPYVSLFYNASGGSTVVFGEQSGGYRVTLGIAPTVALAKSMGIPLTLTFPTSIVLAPTDFYNRGDITTAVCGTTGTAPCATSNFGFFTTGIQGKLALDAIVPKRLGNWYLKAGVQYYHINNESLLAAQVATGAVTTFANAKEDVFVANGGFGFSF